MIPEGEREDMLGAYHRRLMSDDEAVRLEAAKAWSVWEGSTSKLFFDQSLIDRLGEATLRSPSLESSVTTSSTTRSSIQTTT